MLVGAPSALDRHPDLVAAALAGGVPVVPATDEAVAGLSETVSPQGIVAVCTFGILFFLPMVTWLVVVIFSIIAGMKANEGVVYRYPMTWRMVK